MNRVLTVIVTYNGMMWIDRCLSSLVNSSVPTDVYVIDNVSTDGTQEYVKNHFPNVVFYQSEVNLGFGKGNNIGLQYALDKGYEFVYLLNQDAWVMPDTFEKLITSLSANPEYGILSPMQLHPSCNRFELFFGEQLHNEIGTTLLQDIFFHYERSIYSVRYVQAAHWMMTSSCIRKIGGFSPTFPHYGEDDNYCERVLFHGFKLGIVPSALAVHDTGQIKTKAKDFSYKLYIGFLHNISNVLGDKKTFVETCTYAVHLCRRYRSFVPIKSMIKAMTEIKIIRHNLEISKGDCAFLVKNSNVH